ncbi:O-antigen ligase family protein [Aliivibrio kagoshimensis]|uniref:O-antigen ligase family protein n=1 Tax=Aliivibrio kagoshimensis TaxID=2910230 RepID=UPI003D115A8A
MGKHHYFLTFSCCLFVSAGWFLLPNPYMVVVVALLPLAFLFTINATFLLITLFVVFSFFRIHEALPFLYSLKIPLMLSLGSMCALLWHLVVTKKIDIYWTHEQTVMSLFFILVAIGVVMAGNRPVALTYFTAIYWKIALMSFAILLLTREQQHFAYSARIYVISGSLVAVVALMNKVSGIGLVEGSRVTIGRDFGSVLGDPNDLSLVLMFPAAFATSLLLSPRMTPLSRLLGGIGIILILLAILATQSRGGMLGILAVFAVFAYRNIKSKALLISLGMVVAAGMFVMAQMSERSFGGNTEVGVDESSMGRLYAWQAAFRMAVDNPLTGVGIDNFYYNYFYYSAHWDGLNHAVHSTWFGILAETGFLGLLVFIYLIAVLISSCRRSLSLIEKNRATVPADIYMSAQALLAGLAGTVVSGTFLTQGFTWPIYILAALVIALGQWCRTHIRSTSRTGRCA